MWSYSCAYQGTDLYLNVSQTGLTWFLCQSILLYFNCQGSQILQPGTTRVIWLKSKNICGCPTPSGVAWYTWHYSASTILLNALNKPARDGIVLLTLDRICQSPWNQSTRILLPFCASVYRSGSPIGSDAISHALPGNIAQNQRLTSWYSGVPTWIWERLHLPLGVWDTCSGKFLLWRFSELLSLAISASFCSRIYEVLKQYQWQGTVTRVSHSWSLFPLRWKSNFEKIKL